MWKRFISDFRRNLTKIICLTVGLAFSMLLAAKVFFEQTYDSFIPDVDRIYLVTQKLTQGGDDKEYDQIPGGVTPGMMRYVPQVETATRNTNLAGSITVCTEDEKEFMSDGILLADSCHFDIFKTNIIEGNPYEILSVKDQCMIPHSLAEKIGGNVIGTVIFAPGLSKDYKVTIGGVYEDYPDNSSISNKIMLSLCSIGSIFYDGRDNWMGNDRYIGYVKLRSGSDIASMKPALEKMMADHIDKEVLEGLHYSYGFKPLKTYHTRGENIRTMSWILSILALLLILTAGLNYILIVIGQLSHRSKEMAIRKCHGTDNIGIFKMVFAESLFYLLISFGLALLGVWALSGLSKQLLGNSSAELFSIGGIWLVELGIFIFLLIVTGVIPAWLYCRTPVSGAFRNKHQNRKIWKLGLLAIEFTAAGFMMTLLVTIVREYKHLSNTDMGLKYDNVGYVSFYGCDSNTLYAIDELIKKEGCVESTAFASEVFVELCSGNNVWVDDPVVSENVADLYYANPQIFDVLGIEITQGRVFNAPTDTISNEVMVDERMIDVFKKNFGLEDDNLIGKTFHISEHSDTDNKEFTIVGVFKPVMRGGFESERSDKRAAVIFPTPYCTGGYFVKFNCLDEENISRVQSILNEYFHDTDFSIYISPFRYFIDSKVYALKNLGISVMCVGIAILIITLIGLMGYTYDEVNRRSKEIAIRKVNGVSTVEILKMFCLEILKVAVPALGVGFVMALIIGRNWLSLYSSQVSLVGTFTVIAILALALLAILVVIFNSLAISRSNPVKYLRNE